MNPLKMVQNPKIGISVPPAVPIFRVMVGPNLVMFAFLPNPSPYLLLYFSHFRRIESETCMNPLKMDQNPQIGISEPPAVPISRAFVGPNLAMFAFLPNPSPYLVLCFTPFRRIKSEACMSPLKMAQNPKIGISVPPAVPISRVMVGSNMAMLAFLSTAGPYFSLFHFFTIKVDDPAQNEGQSSLSNQLILRYLILAKLGIFR